MVLGGRFVCVSHCQAAEGVSVCQCVAPDWVNLGGLPDGRELDFLIGWGCNPTRLGWKGCYSDYLALPVEGEEAPRVGEAPRARRGVTLRCSLRRRHRLTKRFGARKFFLLEVL